MIVDDKMETLIAEIQDVAKRIIEIEKVLDRQRVIEKAMEELEILKDTVTAVKDYGTDYDSLYKYITSKNEKEKRKNEIIEQQKTLDSQGFSLRNILACKEYKVIDPTYLAYLKTGIGTYSDFLQKRLSKVQEEMFFSEDFINKFERQIQQNDQREEIIRSENHHLDAMIEALNVEINRNIEQALENLKMKFNLPNKMILGAWVSQYHTIYDKCELEVQRLESQSMIAQEKQMLSMYREIIKRDEPMVERCARAVQTLEKMPTLSSFVEKEIRNNIQQISKFFKWMHHSGEFEKLDIDENGIYAVRGLNHQLVRTHEMSTGQRSTIAMAVMFALHMAAPGAPQFLLLDEPLATMDDTQVLNVLDILKSMAEQNTQIFFTTANGIMINLFKECFKNTSFDYKEYQFIKRVNRLSEIRETSINDAKTIEELTLDDLTLDFHQFAQIRDILRKNQEKLVSRDEWEDVSEKSLVVNNEEAEKIVNPVSNSFYSLLTQDEQKMLDILVVDQPKELSAFMGVTESLQDYKIIMESINEKALDFYGETVINSNEFVPCVEEEYLDELLLQHDTYYAYFDVSKLIEEQRRLGESLRNAEEERQKEEALRKEETNLRIQIEEEYRESEAAHVIRLEEERQKAEEKYRKHEEKLRQEEERRLQLEERLRKSEDEHRLQLEEVRSQAEEEYRRREEAQQQEEEQRQKELEQQKLYYRQLNLCQYCGGSFTGLINRRCKLCGKLKDY